MSDSDLHLLIGFGIFIVVFLIAREIVCWYWKINRMVALMESIDESLKQMPAVKAHDANGQRRSSV